MTSRSTSATGCFGHTSGCWISGPGTLSRSAEWTSPAGRTVRVTSVRLVSFTQRAMAAVSYQVEPVGGPARVALQSELVANQQLPPSGGDPRAAAVLEAPLRPEEHRLMMGRAALVHKTGRSGVRVAVAVHHLVDGPAGTGQVTGTNPDVARRTVIAWLEPGQHLHLVKFVAFGWSGTRSRPALRDQVEGALAPARPARWGGPAARH